MGFLLIIILPERHKIDMLHIHQQSDISKIHGQSIIGRNCQHQRLFISKMRFGCHKHCGIYNALLQLFHGISGTWCNCHHIKKSWRTDGFCLHDTLNSPFSCNLLHSVLKYFRCHKSGIQSSCMSGVYRNNFYSFLHQCFCRPEYLPKSTERAGNSKS